MSEPLIHVFRVAAPITNLGYGRRAALWVAGCSIGCPNCCSQDTWAAQGRAMLVSEAASLIEALASRHVDLSGLTVSGGEPTESAQAVRLLLERIRIAHPDWDVLLYSGLPWRRLKARHAELLALCDAVVPELFLYRKPSDHALLGSENQSVRCLTRLGDLRYTQIGPKMLPLEATVTGNDILFSGVPKGDSLDRFSAALERRGILLSSKSWS